MMTENDVLFEFEDLNYGFDSYYNLKDDIYEKEEEENTNKVKEDLLSMVNKYLENTLEDTYGEHTLKECLEVFIELVIKEQSKKYDMEPFTMFYGYILCLAEISYITEEYRDCINYVYSTRYLIDNLFDNTCISDKLVEYVYKQRIRFITFGNLPDMLNNYKKKFNMNLFLYKSIHNMLNILYAYNVVNHRVVPQEIRDAFKDLIINNEIKLDDYITLLRVCTCYEIHTSNISCNIFEYMLAYNNISSDKLHSMYSNKKLNSLPITQDFNQRVKFNCSCRRCNSLNYIRCIRDYNELLNENNNLDNKIKCLKSQVDARDRVISKLKRSIDKVYFKDTIFEIKQEDFPDLLNILYKDHRDVLSRISLIVNSGKTKTTVQLKNGRLVDKTKKNHDYKPVIVKFKDKELYFETLASCAIYFNTTETTLKKYVGERKLYLKSCLIEYATIPRDRFSREYDYQPLSRVLSSENKDVVKLIEETKNKRKS